MSPGRELRDDAAIDAVDVLGEDDVAEEFALATEDGGGGLIARGLQGEEAGSGNHKFQSSNYKMMAVGMAGMRGA
jgi:hypothetical protein